MNKVNINKLLTAELHSLRSAKLSSLMTAETSREQLLELARRLGLHINAICYVEQLKNIPAPTSTKANYIINLHEPAHWTAIHINGKKGYYFNSFSAIMPIPTEVIRFLKKCKCTMYYDSDKSVQTTNQGNCGEFSLDFLVHMNKLGNPTNNYENFLHDLHSTNKENIYYFIRHLA